MDAADLYVGQRIIYRTLAGQSYQGTVTDLPVNGMPKVKFDFAPGTEIELTDKDLQSTDPVDPVTADDDSVATDDFIKQLEPYIRQ